MEHNPYGAPQVDLIEPMPVVALTQWSARRLSLLAWLSLVSVIGTLLSLVISFGQGWNGIDSAPYQLYVDGLNLGLTLLGCYLLIGLKGFAQARFAARHLAWPVWCCVIISALMGGLGFWFGEAAMSGLSWQTFVYLGLMVPLGGVTLWLGIALLKVEQSYPSFRLMAWLDIAGGACLASVILLVVAVVPLLGASLAMMAVFFKGAAEQRAR
ncbi:MAG: hypothetical protein V4812_08245 [Pseudomonadota bacterium]